MAHILVIDDERSIRNTLKEILEYEKFTVELAEHGLEGLEMYKKGGYDIVLCDIKMPEMDGLEVLEKIFEEEGDAQVIMISGHGNIDNAVEAIKKGALMMSHEFSESIKREVAGRCRSISIGNFCGRQCCNERRSSCKCYCLGKKGRRGYP